MQDKINTLMEWIHIVLSVASKDILDAFKNRLTISIILGVGMIVLSGQLLPLVIKLQPEQRAYVFDESGSTFVQEHRQGDGFRLIPMPSLEAMQEQVAAASSDSIGLVLPAYFPERVAGKGPLELQVYYPYAMRGKPVEEAMAFFTAQLSEIFEREISLTCEDNVLYPSLKTGGHPFMVGISLVVAILTIGMALVPLLMIEEKERHTMEALLVSPASYGQIVVGKAVSGLFYCFLAVAVVYTLNARLLANGWLALLAVLASALFTVSLGLLFGVLFEQQASMNMVMGLTLMLLMVPVILAATTITNYPPLIQTILPWLPSVAMVELFSASFSKTLDWGTLFFNFSILAGTALLLLVMVTARVRRMDR
jgi:ABC-2 type transport system permease protein